jgi:8-oxo-dGTP diphosphatase
VIVPGPGDTLTFVGQERGPYAGSWVLPGGKVEFGEPITHAARREVAEEIGYTVLDMSLAGAYEIHGPDHHFIMWAYLGEDIAEIAPDFHGHHVGGVRQVGWRDLEPHPTDMPILNDAGVAAYSPDLIEDRLAARGIHMTNLLTGQVFGRALTGAVP